MADLQTVALRVELISTLSAIEREAERQYETLQTIPSSYMADLEVTRWQHITGRTFKALEASTSTMHEISRGLVGHWAKKLVALLWPYRELLPVWNALKSSAQPLVHFTDVFRSSRWTTLRRRTLSWARYARAVCPPLPLNEAQIADWLESSRATLTKSSLKAIRSLFSFLCEKTGLTNICLGGIITNKVKAILAEVRTIHSTSSRKAATVPVSGIAYLEEIAASPENECDGILASGFRFAAGASARPDDTKHTRISGRRILEYTVEIICTQTKVSGITKSKGDIVLIAPMISFHTDSMWWNAFDNNQSLMDGLWVKNGRLKEERDWICPHIPASGRALTLKPGGNRALLGHLRRILSHRITKNAILSEITLPSLRVFMADLAQQAGIEKERRQALGKWESEDEPDVYARTFRTQIIAVWKDTLAKIGELDSGGGRWVFEDPLQQCTDAQPSAEPAATPRGAILPLQTVKQSTASEGVVQRWIEALEEEGVANPMELEPGVTLFPPLILNRSTSRLHWGCRDTVQGPVAGTICNKWKIAGFTGLHTFTSPDEFFQFKVIWCEERRAKLALPQDWKGTNIITASPPSSDQGSSNSSNSGTGDASDAPSASDQDFEASGSGNASRQVSA